MNYITATGVQQVSITIASGSLTGTATITGVGSGAFIVYQGATCTETGAGTLNDSVSRIELTNSTTITATRGATGTSKTVTINAVIVDGDTTNLIKSVQSGTITIAAAGTSNTATISAVTNNNTAVAYLGQSFGGSATSEANLAILGLSGTTLTATIGAAPATGNVVVGYCVIEFQGAAMNQAVQNVAYNGTDAAVTSKAMTITSVSTANSFVIFSGWTCSGSGLAPAREAMYCDLTNSTTLTVHWNTVNSNVRRFNCCVVELVSGIVKQNIQRGTIALSAASSNTATITSSSTTNGFCNFLSNSSTDATGNPSINLFRITQTNATTLTLNANSAASGTASYEVIEFPAFISGITFDAASNSTYQSASSSYSWSHTCTGSNRYLVVGIAMLSLAQTVSSITYAGENLALLGVRSSITGAARVELWGIVAPATGSNTIAVTLSGSIASAGCASSYAGVNQSSSTEGYNSAQATNVGAADATVNITTVADNDWVVDIVATDDTAITVGAGNTSRNNVTGVGGSGAMGDTNGAKTPAGSVTMSWTNVGALATWAIGGIALRPTAASNLPSTVFRKTFSSIGTHVGTRQLQGWN